MVTFAGADIAVAAVGRTAYVGPILVWLIVTKDGEWRAGFNAVIACPTGQVGRQDLAKVLIRVDTGGVLEANFVTRRRTTTNVSLYARAGVVNISRQIRQVSKDGRRAELDRVVLGDMRKLQALR